MERRVLIVESQNDFALTMASVLKDAGYQTSLAASAGDAARELEKRRPDLVVSARRAVRSERLRAVRQHPQGALRAKSASDSAVFRLRAGGAPPAQRQPDGGQRLPRHPLRDGRTHPPEPRHHASHCPRSLRRGRRRRRQARVHALGRPPPRGAGRRAAADARAAVRPAPPAPPRASQRADRRRQGLPRRRSAPSPIARPSCWPSRAM